MGNDYWKDDSLIVATHKDKMDLLKYEIGMFFETCDRMKRPACCGFINNLIIESLAVHTRVLIDFFYSEKNANKPNDLVAQDLLSDEINWKRIRPEEADVLFNAKNKADKQLAHLSLWRIKLSKDELKGWGKMFPDIERELKDLINFFYSLLK